MIEPDALFTLIWTLNGSGRSVAWLARLLGVQEVESSNLSAPTILTYMTPFLRSPAVFFDLTDRRINACLNAN